MVFHPSAKVSHHGLEDGNAGTVGQGVLAGKYALCLPVNADGDASPGIVVVSLRRLRSLGEDLDVDIPHIHFHGRALLLLIGFHRLLQPQEAQWRRLHDAPDGDASCGVPALYSLVRQGVPFSVDLGRQVLLVRALGFVPDEPYGTRVEHDRILNSSPVWRPGGIAHPNHLYVVESAVRRHVRSRIELPVRVPTHSE